MNAKKILVILAFALSGWALCAAIMGIGMGLTTLQNALVAHAFAAPVIFGLLSFGYFKKFNFTAPMHTAILFTGIVIFMDTFVVALIVQKSFEMFTSALGTWIPFMLIFSSTYATGIFSRSSSTERNWMQ